MNAWVPMTSEDVFLRGSLHITLPYAIRHLYIIRIYTPPANTSLASLFVHSHLRYFMFTEIVNSTNSLILTK